MKTSVSVLQKFFPLLNVLQAKKSVKTCDLLAVFKYSCVIVMCFFTLAVLPAQDVSETSVISEVSAEETTAATDDYQPIVVFASQEESNSQINTQQESQPSTVWLFVRMILVLVFVVACIYFVVYFLKKTTKGGISTSDPYLRVVANISLAPGKTVYVITLNSIGYILGVTDNSINLIGTFDDTDLINLMNINADKNNTSAQSKDFASLLKFFHLQKKDTDTKKEKDSVLSSSVDASVQFIKKQQERLNDSTENTSEESGDNL